MDTHRKRLKEIFNGYSEIRAKLEELKVSIDSLSNEYFELHEKLTNSRKEEKELINKLEEVEGRILTQSDLFEIVTNEN
jgi:peptidoglycan hydrolase CwlO-like protein